MFYRLCWHIGNFLLRYFYRWKVEGVDNLPSEGGVVIVSNHANFFDPVIVGCCFPRKVHFMAKLELFRVPILNWVIMALGAFPVKRGVADKAAFEASFRFLESGQVVGLFPEGTRFMDGRLHPLRSGVAALAVKGNSVVLPMIIRNSSQIKFMRFPKVCVHIGEAFRIPDILEGSSEKEKMHQAVAYIEEQMRQLWRSSQPSDQLPGDPMDSHRGTEAAS